MQIAALQPLAPVLAGGVVLYGAGSLRPDGPMGRARKVGLVAALVVGAIAAIVGLFLLMGTMLDSHPTAVPFLVIALVAIFSILYVSMSRPKPPPLPSETQRRDEDGGGGQRRPDPTPPQDPPGPAAPDLPWHEFDDLRSTWERVPAGHV